MAPRLDATGQALRLHTGLETADLTQLGGGEPLLAPTQWLDERLKGLAHAAVPRTGPGTYESLTLPRRGPSLVVLAVGVQRAAQRPLPALRAQVRVHDERVRAGHGEQTQREAGDGVGLRGRLGGAHARSRPVHEEDVRVRGVGQLAPAQASHVDDGVVGQGRGPGAVLLGQAHVRALTVRQDHAGGHGQGAAQDGVGGVGEDAGAASWVHAVQGVRQGRAQELARAQRGQGVEGVGDLAGRRRPRARPPLPRGRSLRRCGRWPGRYRGGRGCGRGGPCPSWLRRGRCRAGRGGGG